VLPVALFGFGPASAFASGGVLVNEPFTEQARVDPLLAPVRGHTIG
jgi:hypothetical protein